MIGLRGKCFHLIHSSLLLIKAQRGLGAHKHHPAQFQREQRTSNLSASWAAYPSVELLAAAIECFFFFFSFFFLSELAKEWKGWTRFHS